MYNLKSPAEQMESAPISQLAEALLYRVSRATIAEQNTIRRGTLANLINICEDVLTMHYAQMQNVDEGYDND